MKNLLVKVVPVLLCLALLAAALPAAPQRVYAQAGPPVYLPLIGLPPGPPQFRIISPVDGLAISGTSLFAVQPINASTVQSVAFKAGAVELGVDTTPADGFQLFLDASELPNGPVQLAATATGPTGETATQVIEVTVVAQPPASAAIGPGGGTLATATGSTIVVPPGAVSRTTTISIQDKSQAQVTADNGIDWDGLGVTFLGAIDVQASGPISQPIGVSSVGFGNRVQPNQAVVTYRILPDADGDGVGELVVVNGANLAPNGTIVSSAVPELILNTITVEAPAAAVAAAQTLHGPPGTMLAVTGSGFNPLSLQGNLAIFTSQVNGATVAVPGDIDLESSPDQQIFRVLIPVLPAGPATLTLRNESTGATAGPVALTIDAAPPLSDDPSALIDSFFAQSLEFVEGLPGEADARMTSRAELINQLAALRSQFQDLADDPSPEAQQLITTLATTIEGSDAINELVQANAAAALAPHACMTPRQKNLLNLLIGLLGVAGAASCALAFTGAAAVACGAIIGALAVIDQYLVAEVPECPKNPPPCAPAPAASGGGTTGMGAAPPPGGNGCGSVGGGGAGGGFVRSTNLHQLENGRYTVRIFPQAGGAALTPFTGATDPGGYFFLPLIPENEPFRALALDTFTGAAATAEGVGPPTGESVYLYFNFAGAQGNRYEITIGDTISNGVPAEGAGNIETAGGLDIYTFTATPGQQIFVDLLDREDALAQVDWQLVDSTGTQIFRTCLGCGQPGVQTLALGGLYTLRVGNDNDPGTGTYSFKLWDVPPADEFAVNVGITISNGVPGPGAGNIETPGVKDVYTFNATPGQQVFVNLLTSAPAMSQLDWLLVDGAATQIFRTCLGCSQPGVQTLALGGVYTVTVGDDRDDATGVYSFTLWNVPPADEFAISVGDTISNGVPGAGAGNIETPGVKDLYTFNATPGQQIFVDLLAAGPTMSQIDWQLVDSAGALIFRTCLGCGQPGVQTLARGGVYTLTVGDDRDDAVGVYSFKLWDVPPADEFAISVGDTISNGVPGPGAGNIETPGVKDVYTFNATPGQQVVFDRLALAPGMGQVDWQLVDSAGTQVFRTCLGCTEPGLRTLTLGGVYTLTVGDDRDEGTGAYSFEVRTP